jgi:hypothetical protein
METPKLDKVREAPYPTQLQLAILFYGDEQTCSDEELQDAEQAAAEYEALQAENTRLKEAITLAQEELRSTQINWQEDCLFDCDDILTNALKG